MVDWASIEDLGKVADSVIARRLGVTRQCVSLNRVKLGIPPLHTRCVNKGIKWNAQPLGEMKDEALAAALGVSESVVQAARAKRGIQASLMRINVDWDKVPLGVIPDCAMANLLGCSDNPVTVARTKRGLPPGLFPQLPGRYREQMWPLIDWSRFPLGCKPDRVIARALRVPVGWVQLAREERNIPRPAQNEHLMVATLSGKCDCGLEKKPDLVACDRCIKLDGIDVRGINGAILSELRIMGASTLGQLTRAVGWKSGNGSLTRNMTALVAAGRVRRFGVDGLAYYCLASDVGRACYDSSSE